MFSKLFLLVAAVSAVAAVPHKGFKRPNYDNIDYYDCSGKADGNYVHPTDCTRFIMCSNGRAADMACPDCDMNNVSGCAGSPYQFWDQDKDRCEWPRDTHCAIQEPEEPEEPEEPQRCGGKKAGDACQPDDCEHCGWCENKNSSYFRCERTFPSDPKLPASGVIVREECDADLWWNPDLKPSGATQGGACDRWDNLSDEVKEGYKSDEGCVAPEPVCEWGQDEDDKCSGNFWFFNPETMAKREDLKCNDDLLWDQASETCRNSVAGC